MKVKKMKEPVVEDMVDKVEKVDMGEGYQTIFVDSASYIQLNPYVAKIHFVENMPDKSSKPKVCITMPLGEMLNLVHKLLMATSDEKLQEHMQGTYQELLASLPQHNAT